jgi:ferredoxin-NADP reductase
MEEAGSNREGGAAPRRQENPMPYTVTLLMTEFVTHDVKRFIVERPDGYKFAPGQATEVAIDRDGWRDRKRPFTFTSLDEDRLLEFTIKRYPDHHGVTDILHQLEPGARLIIGEAWGTIQYQGTGVFVAGGAGLTPFIAILRRLWHDRKLTGNKLIFSNKTARDIILEPELREALGDGFYPVLTQEDRGGCHQGRIDKRYLEETLKSFAQHFYICGPEDFVSDLKETLAGLGASPATIVVEE